MGTSEDRHLLTVLAQYEVSLHEWVLLGVVWHSPKPYGRLPEIAASWAQEDFRGRVRLVKLRRAMRACESKGWLRCVNRNVLREVRELLAAAPSIGPLGGLPRIGDVDFTRRGAKLTSRIVAKVYGARLNSSPVYEKGARAGQRWLYFKTLAAANKAVKALRSSEGRGRVFGPVPIGAWRVYWWEKHRRGYKIRIRCSAAG
jgi:hypothetical protein